MEKLTSLQSARIVLIDRDEIGLFVNQLMFRQCGYTGTITLFDNLDAATTYLETETPDMVVMDYFQSYMDSFDLMEKVHITPDVQLVVIAEFITDKKEIEARLGNCKFLRKPLSRDAIHRVCLEP